MTTQAAATPGSTTPAPLLAGLPSLHEVLREVHRRSFYAFFVYMWPELEPTAPYIEAQHTRVICEHLQAVYEGRIPELAIEIGPGYGKSFISAVAFPAWIWACRDAGYRMGFSTYADDLTTRDSGRFLRLIKSEMYQALYGHRFKLIKEREDWQTNNKGGYRVALSVKGQVTGHRFNLWIGDDLLNLADAKSDVKREPFKVHLTAVATRGQIGKPYYRVIIGQRLHEDDPGNYAREKGFQVLCLPTEYDPSRHCETREKSGKLIFSDWRTERGELLFPNGLGADRVAQAKTDLGPDYSAQHQQLPIPADGGIIKAEYLNTYAPKETPVFSHHFFSVDTAQGQDAKNDKTGLSIHGVHTEGISLVDGWTGRERPAQFIQRLKDSRPVSELLTDLAEQTNSTRETDERTGRIRTKLIREGDLAVVDFDESNLIELSSFSRNNPDLAPNRITVPFVDRSQNWVERVAIAKNPAGIKGAGTIIDYRADFFGVSREELAGRLASREARKHGSALVRASWVGVVPIGTILKPFDLVTLKHPKLGLVVRMRVLSARFASYEGRLRVELEGIEDVFRGGYAGITTVIPGLPGAGSTTPPASLTNASLQLAPYALHGDDADHLVYSALDPDTATNTFRLAYQDSYLWQDANGYVFADDEQEPAVTGMSNSLLTTLTYNTNMAFTLSAAAAQQWARETRKSVYFQLGTEWLECAAWSLQGTTLNAQGIKRGLFDTLPQEHAAGSTARFLLGYVVLPRRCKTNPGGGLPVLDGYQSLTARAESRGPGGNVSPSAAAASSALWQYSDGQTRAIKPLPPKQLRLAGTLGALSGLETPPNISRSASLQLTWANRNRLSRNNADYFDTGIRAVPWKY